MLDRLRDSAPVRRLAAAGSRFFDTFIRDNRVIPPVLALLALVVFAWIVAGLFVGAPDEEPTSNREDLVQAENPAPEDPPAPEMEVRDVDSYAAYQNKDPFRELLAPAEAAEDTIGETTTQEETTTGDQTGGGDGDRPGGRDGGRDPTRQDSDGDGISDEREEALGLDPNNPDTDGDGVPDNEEDRPGRGDRPRGDGGDLQDSGGPGTGGDRRRGLPESGGSF